MAVGVFRLVRTVRVDRREYGKALGTISTAHATTTQRHQVRVARMIVGIFADRVLVIARLTGDILELQDKKYGKQISETCKILKFSKIS